MYKKFKIVLMAIMILFFSINGPEPVTADTQMNLNQDESELIEVTGEEDKTINVIPEIFVDGKKAVFSVAPELINENIMVPVKGITEAAGATLSRDKKSDEIVIERSDITLRFTMDSNKASINGQQVEMPIQPRVINAVLQIPLKFFAEAFEYQLTPDPVYNRIDLDSPPTGIKVSAFFIPGDEQDYKWLERVETFETSADLSQDDTRTISRLSLGWYSMKGDGTLLNYSATGWWRPPGWQDVLKAAREQNLETEMVIYMSNYDGKVSKLINNQKAVKQAVSDIVKEARMYDGVNLDLEGLGENETQAQLEKTRLAFTSFIKTLKQDLEKEGCCLTLTLHPPNSIFQGYDYQALGQIADRIVIMAYDYGIKPEPQRLVDEALDMALASVPAEKLVLGISTSSEEQFSIRTKLYSAEQRNIPEIAMWYWGGMTDDIWEVINLRISTDNVTSD